MEMRASQQKEREQHKSEKQFIDVKFKTQTIVTAQNQRVT